MFRAELWRAIVATAGSKSLAVERVHLRACRSAKRYMERRLNRRTFHDKELLILISEADPRACLCPHGNSGVAVIPSAASACV